MTPWAQQCHIYFYFYCDILQPTEPNECNSSVHFYHLTAQTVCPVEISFQEFKKCTSRKKSIREFHLQVSGRRKMHNEEGPGRAGKKEGSLGFLPLAKDLFRQVFVLHFFTLSLSLLNFCDNYSAQRPSFIAGFETFLMPHLLNDETTGL